MRQSARAIIIHDKKLLLVTGHNAGFYWTPGGGLEPGEQPIETLRRELHEELSLVSITINPFLSYVINDQAVNNFIVTTNDPIIPSHEIANHIWYSPADLQNTSIKISDGVRQMVIPKLVQDGLL